MQPPPPLVVKGANLFIAHSCWGRGTAYMTLSKGGEDRGGLRREGMGTGGEGKEVEGKWKGF